MVDTKWIKRLLGAGEDAPLGATFLHEYSKALRLLSGLRAGSLGQVAIRANQRRYDENFRKKVLSEPAVQEFVQFLSGFRKEEIPVVVEVIASELVPSQPRRMFRASLVDPLTHPTTALLQAAGELAQLEGEFPSGTSVPDLSPERPPWDDASWNVDAFIETVYGVRPPSQGVLPSVYAGVCGPSQNRCPDFSFTDSPRVVCDTELLHRWRHARKRRNRTKGPEEAVASPQRCPTLRC